MQSLWHSPARTTALLLTLLVPAGGSTPLAQEPTPPAAAPEAPEEGIRLTLREALAMALDQNLTIAVQRYEPHIVENEEVFEHGVFDPSLGVFGLYEDSVTPSADALQGALVRADDSRFARISYSDPTAIGGNIFVEVNGNRFATNSTFFGLNPVYNANLILAYNQSFLRNFGYDVNTTGIRIARRNAQISDSRFRQTVIDTISAVEQAYWNLAFARNELGVREHSLRLSEETLAQNKIRVDVGTMAPIDVTTAEAEVASRRQLVLLAENAVQNTQDTFTLLINAPRTSQLWFQPIIPSDEPPFDENLTFDVKAAVEEADRSRPDLEQTRIEIENDADRVARARDLTQWDLVGSARYERTGLAGRSEAFLLDPNDPLSLVPARDEDLTDAFSEIVDENFDTWQLSINLIIPLGNRQAEANYATTRLRQDQRQQVLEAQLREAAVLVRNRVRAVENTVERVKAARVNVRLQQERLRAENKRYENGMTTTFNLFQFQDDLTQSESQVSLALVDYNKALIELEAAKGTLPEARGVHVADIRDKAGSPRPRE